LPLYEFKHCGKVFEIRRPMSEAGDDCPCPECGEKAQRLYSPPHDIWGWILTEKSHHIGNKDEFVKAKPSNDLIVDNTKAPYTKTIY